MSKKGLRENPKLTPEGRAFQLENVTNNRDALVTSMDERIITINQLMETATNFQTVRTELTNLDYELQEFHFCSSRIKTLADEENIHEDELFVNQVDERIFNEKTKILQWIKKYDESVQPARKSPSRSSHRSSKRSSRSGSSRSSGGRSSKSAKELYMQEAAKMAALQAESEFKSKLVSLESERKIASQQAKLNVYGHFMKSEDENRRANTSVLPPTTTNDQTPSYQAVSSSVSSSNPTNINNIHMTTSSSVSSSHPTTSSMSSFRPMLPTVPPSFKPYVPFQARMTSTEEVTPKAVVEAANNNNPISSAPVSVKPSTIAATVSSLLKMQSAPEPIIDTFYGNPLDFKYFITTFEEVIETKIDEARGRLIRLIQFTSGEAKDLIKGCIHLTPEKGYEQAKSLLTKRFGDPYRVLSAYRKEVQELKQIKHADATSLRQLYSFLVKSNHIIGNQFDTPDNICLVLSKLPGNLRDRWNRFVYQIRRNHDREPRFNDLIEFIDKETILANDPLYSKEAVNGTPAEPTKNKTVRNFSSNIVKCLFCGKSHDIDKCFAFKKLEFIERGKWTLKNRYCFACFKKGHIARECKWPRKCEQCSGKHPTSLHGCKRAKQEPESVVTDESSQKPESSQPIDNHAVRNNDYINMCIVPVLVKLQQNHISTYALLDNCSQGTFIDEELLTFLGSKFPETEINVKTLNGEEVCRTKVAEGLQVRGMEQTRKWINLPKTFSRRDFSVSDQKQPITKEVIRQWPHLHPLRDHLFQTGDDQTKRVRILIGANCPKAIQPLKVIPSPVEKGPYAFETNLGWCIAGPLTNCDNTYTSCFRVNFDVKSDRKPSHLFVKQQQMLDNSIEKMIRHVYGEEQQDNDRSLGDEFSQEDIQFLKIMDTSHDKVSGHYILPLPFRNEKVNLPNNRAMALKRLNLLKKKFGKDPIFRTEYTNFIDDMLSKGYAQKVQSSYPEDEQWFVPHHGVYHPRKKKIRVVFDCSSKFRGKSLNSELIQGPDLTNQLVGVLTRFREHTIATMGDIESMFYQVRIPEDQRRYLQFLWWEDGDSRKSVHDYEMCVHLFGSTSSPSCANYALRKAASEGESKYGSEASNTLRRSFYVDDMLKSTEEIAKTIQVVKDVRSMCQDGGFNLTKIISNSREVMESIPEQHRIKELQKSLNVLPNDHALGVQWNTTEDTLSLRTKTFDIPTTKRGLLSTIHQIYDPLGMVSPFLLESKRLLQHLCSQKIGWDETLPNDLQQRCREATSTLLALHTISIPRCFHPVSFVVKRASLHHFSDASEIGHGYCSYIRLQDPDNNIHCAFVCGRSRVNPIKSSITMPRLELMAAALSSKLGSKLPKELDIPIQHEVYWTDSKVVLGYLNNNTKKFKLFVSNRVTFIKDRATSVKWRYVSSEDNPSDIPTRVLRADDTERIKTWLHGPEFLWKSLNLDDSTNEFVVNNNDPEIIKSSDTLICAATAAETNYFLSVIGNISSWQRIVRVTAFVLRFINNCHNQGEHPMKLRSQQSTLQPLVVDELENAKRKIFQVLQLSKFSNTVHRLQRKEKIERNSNLIKLDPFVHTDGLMRVGGRLQHSSMDFEIKHPIIIPKDCSVTKSLIRFHHNNTFHSGRGITINEIRNNGLWIINTNSMVRQVIHHCVVCRHLRGAIIQQKMNDLPVDRIEAAPPFTYTGVDLFGPFYIKVRRSSVKRYGVLFTCLASRAVHIEAVHSMETDSFILSLRRLVARRGNIRMIRSDNGTNFVGADKQLHEEFMKMNHSKISDFLSQHNGDWVVWKRNPPHASNYGGVWERHIRTARNILSGMLKVHGEILHEESFQTLLAEVENVINSRPLSVENLNDPSSLKPISPMTLLTQKSKVVYPLPGKFDGADVYSRKHWRRVQHLVNEFWERWRKEYLNSLQERSKWHNELKNAIAINDVVLLKDDKPRNEWSLARVTKLKPDENGLLRTVEIELANKSKLQRPLNKIIILQKYNV